jgi:SAM-dependent methyltransferase
MDVTNRFVLHYARRYEQQRPGARMLDYGCGAGELVAEASAAGLDMCGADIFYGGSAAREQAAAAGRLGASVHEIRGGRLDFSDGSFDLIVNNQVMEHVEDLDQVLDELCRVLNPDGTLLSIFPSRDVLREGHIGIPFCHWFKAGSRIRFFYTWALRALGLGTWKDQASSPRQWAVDKLHWIDTHTRYRARADIFCSFNRHFTTTMRERDYIAYRLRQTRALAPLARLTHIPGVSAAGVSVFRKLAFMVLESRRRKE